MFFIKYTMSFTSICRCDYHSWLSRVLGGPHIHNISDQIHNHHERVMWLGRENGQWDLYQLKSYCYVPTSAVSYTEA